MVGCAAASGACCSSASLATLCSSTRFAMRSSNSTSLSVRTLFLGLSCAASSAAPSAACLRLVVAVVVVVVVTAATGEVFRDAALGGALRAGGSAEGARETLRLRVVVVSGEASAAFCDRVAGIVVVVVERRSRVVVVLVVREGEGERGLCCGWIRSRAWQNFL